MLDRASRSQRRRRSRFLVLRYCNNRRIRSLEVYRYIFLELRIVLFHGLGVRQPRVDGLIHTVGTATLFFSIVVGIVVIA